MDVLVHYLGHPQLWWAQEAGVGPFQIQVVGAATELYLPPHKG